MAKKISKLVQKALNTADYTVKDMYRIQPSAAFCERFAQLIINECGKVADKYVGVAASSQDLVKHFDLKN